MKRIFILIFIQFWLIESLLPAMAITLEEQANKIEQAKNDARNEMQKIAYIFDEYKKVVQITTGQPYVSDSDGNEVTISMDVFVELKNPDLQSQIIDVMNRYFRFVKSNGSYLEISIAAGGNDEAWDELAKNSLIAEISFLGSTSKVPLFGTFDNWFNVKVIEKEKFNVSFWVDKKLIKNMDNNPAPKIALITKVCQIKDGKYGKRQNMCLH